MANYSYPTQVGAIKRKDKTFAVDAKLFPEDGNVAGPLILHAGYSRFVFSIIDKKQNIVPTANIPYLDIPYIKKQTDALCFSKNAIVSEEKENNIAFSTPLVGHFKGQSPGQVLLDNPGNMDKLLSTKNWLLENLQKFPPNKSQIDAIDEAVKLYNSGSLVAPTSSSAIASNKEEIYSSEWKFLKSKPGDNNTFFIYNLEISYYPSNKYPVEIKIENGFAPLSEQAGGQTTILLSKTEGKSSTSILLTVKEWYTLISKVSRILKQFEDMLFKQQFDKMTNIISSYH